MAGRPGKEKALQVFVALAGWFALVAQFYLILVNRQAPVTETIIRYFSFFTILTNLLVAYSYSLCLLAPGSGQAAFFSRPQVRTAITVYILVVGIVYNSILRFLWNPQGLQWFTDELLHTVIPLACLAGWFFFLNKASLQWKQVFPWLLYPFLYAVYIFIRGAFSGFYPYPFINAAAIGWQKAFLHAGYLTVFFFFMSLLLLGIAKWQERKKALVANR